MEPERGTIQQLRKKAAELGFDLSPCFEAEKITLSRAGSRMTWVCENASECMAFLHGFALGVIYGS